MRLGKMQIKVGFILMIKKFKYELEDRLETKELQFEPKSGLLDALDAINLHVFKR